MGRHYILKDKTPVPVELMEWARWFENTDNHRVAVDTIAGNPDVTVSTVFLGLDHQFGEGKPLLFQTMVFGGELDQEMERHSTWKEAEEGHRSMLERVRSEK